jgi:hypothetical protein
MMLDSVCHGQSNNDDDCAWQHQRAEQNHAEESQYTHHYEHSHLSALL